MKTSEPGLNLIKIFEKCVLVAYPDPKTGGAPWTVGWGSTGPDVENGTIWTQQEADERLARDVAHNDAILSQFVTSKPNQNMWDALSSILYNVGPGRVNGKDGIIWLRNGKKSTLLNKLNAGDYSGCADEFLRWVSPGTNVEKGLRIRRTAERDLFLTPYG